MGIMTKKKHCISRLVIIGTTSATAKRGFFLRASASLLSSPQTSNLTNLQNTLTGQSSHGRKVGAARTGAIQRKKSPGKTFQRLNYFASSRVMQKHEERSKLQKSSPPLFTNRTTLGGKKIGHSHPATFHITIVLSPIKKDRKVSDFRPLNTI